MRLLSYLGSLVVEHSVLNVVGWDPTQRQLILSSHLVCAVFL